MYVCVRLLYVCTDFAYFYAKILRTYTPFIFRTLCKLCVRILLIFCDVQCGQSWGIWSCRFLNLFYPWERSWFLDSIQDPILRVPSMFLSARFMCYFGTVSRIRSWGFRKFLCPRKLLVIHRPILPWRFLVGIDRAIYFPFWVILLCIMLLCGSYIHVATFGTLGVIMIS